jgi:predicted SAM-dependent methyltransferase
MGEVLEHFTLLDGTKLLRECYRVLKPAGVIRIRVPDNARFWGNYLDEFKALKQGPRSAWNTHHSRWVEMFFREICVRKPGRFQSIGHFHKWMYDEVSLVKLLEELGFRDVNRMEFHKSRLADIERVEARDDLIVEGVK